MGGTDAKGTDLKFGIKTLLVVLALIAIPLAFLPRGYDRLMRFDRNLHNRVGILETGTPKSEVLRLLDPPLQSDSKCCLPQVRGFEDEFARANDSGAVRFFLWRNGLNWYYCIGFDENDLLTIVVEGHS